MHNVHLFLPGDPLSQAELSAARLDGDVVEVGDAYTPTDRVETPHLRAAGIAEHRRGHHSLAFAGASAAWIHGAGNSPPGRHELQLTSARRVRSPSSRRILLHETPLCAADVTALGEVLVASPGRTLLDLIRWSARHDSALSWAHALAAARPDVLPEARERIEHLRGRPGHRSAAALFERLSDERRRSQEEVTR